MAILRREFPELNRTERKRIQRALRRLGFSSAMEAVYARRVQRVLSDMLTETMVGLIVASLPATNPLLPTVRVERLNQ